MTRRIGFRRFDAFSKTIEDAQIKTTNGGLITIISIIIIFILVSFEWHDYRRVVVLPELTIDRTRSKFKIFIFLLTFTNIFFFLLGEKLQINLNLTFPKIPCSSIY